MEMLHDFITTDSGSPPLRIGREGTFELPVIGVETVYGNPEVDDKPSLLPKEPLPDMHVNLPASRASQLAVYWVNRGDDIHGYSYLAPKGWTAQSSKIGANASTGLELVSSDQSITFYYDGFCAGCTTRHIGEYFPSLHDWAQKEVVVGEIPKHPDWKIVMIDNHTVAYSFRNANGQEVNGVAVEKHGEHEQPSFWKAEVTVDDHELASVILNCFLSSLSEQENLQ